jgi:hypothetical protein
MTINLRTGEEYAPRREDYCTKIAAVAPAHIDTPTWLGFLDKVTAGDIELQAYLQRMAGYCMTGDTCREKSARPRPSRHRTEALGPWRPRRPRIAPGTQRTHLPL